MEAGHLAARKHAVASVARVIGDQLAAGSAVISATGARLSRITRNLAGHELAAHEEATMPDQVRTAVDRALAAEVARWPVRSGDAWQDAVLTIPRPRTATA